MTGALSLAFEVLIGATGGAVFGALEGDFGLVTAGVATFAVLVVVLTIQAVLGVPQAPFWPSVAFYFTAFVVAFAAARTAAGRGERP